MEISLHLKVSSPLLPFFILFFLLSAHATGFKIPRLHTSKLRRSKIPRDPKSISSSSDLKTYFYTQTLDHFNYRPESYATFRQRYYINSRYWVGPNSSAPIFAYFGGEQELLIDDASSGILLGLGPFASRFKALLVYIEHRFYGESKPLESMEIAMKNKSIRGYFNSAQALADSAAILVHVKDTFAAKKSPIIVIGCSYSGMLAAWFRLKYPHIAVGALASSAPVLYFDSVALQIGYYSIIFKKFQETSENCYETIKKSWEEIDKIASKPKGLSILSKKFNTCSELKRSFDLKDYLDSIYAEAAQFNDPYFRLLNDVCGGIDGATEGTDILGRIFAGVVAYMGNKSCYDMDEYIHPTESFLGWRWQTCSELVMPIGHEKNASMFPFQPFNLSSYIEECKSLFGVQPRPHWVTTYYGGHDFKLILHRFASNIIFSNGLSDPYSSGGVLENISDSVVAISTKNGCHCLDLKSVRDGDPEWLTQQREKEVETIEGWISVYCNDLKKFG